MKQIKTYLKQAKKALSQNKFFFDLNEKIANELMELNIVDSKEIIPLLTELLEEIQPEDFVGSREDHSLAFEFASKKLNQKVLLKFLVNDGHFFYLSLIVSHK